MPTAEVESVTPPPVASPPPEEPKPRKNGPARGEGGRPVRGHHDPAESSEAEKAGFWQEVSEITETGWESHVMYLYRWLPYYDMTKGGVEPKYVCLYTSATTIDDIMKQHGSGRYNIKLNKKDANQRSDRTIRQIVFDIMNPQYPPALPDGDWQNDPRNKQWVWGKGRAGADTIPSNNPGGPGPGGMSVKDMREILEMGKQRSGGIESEMLRILPDLIRERNAAQPAPVDPMTMLTQLMGVMKMMLPAPVAPAPPDNTMTEFILTQLNLANERAEKQNALIITLIQQKAEPVKQPDAMDMLDRMAGIFGKVSDVRESLGGGGGSSRMNGWQEVASAVGTELIKAVGPVLPFMLRGQPQRPAAPAAQPRLPGTAPNPAAPAPAATQPAPAAAAPVDNVQEEDMDAASFLANQMQALGIISPMLTYFNDGETGLRFAMWIADGHGAMPLNLIKGQGKAVVLRAVTDHLPQLYAQLQPNWGKFDLFVDSFLTWTPNSVLPEDEEDDEDEDDTLPVGAAPSAPAPAPPSGTPPAPPRAAAPTKARAPKKAAATKKVGK